MACPENAVMVGILEYSYRLMVVGLVCTIYMLGVFAFEVSCYIYMFII